MATAQLTVSVIDLPQFQQLVWELRMLENDMRVGASPFADRLSGALDRAFRDRDDDREEPTDG